MIKAVLLDLDDTLLRVDTDAFAKKYLAAMGGAIIRAHPHIQPDKFQHAVRLAIGAILENRDLSRINAELITASFVEHLGLTEAQLTEVFDRFYSDGYLALRGEIGATDGAAELVAALAQKNLQIVLATNPVFPRQATHERVRWAGFDPDGGHFKLITTLDNMHFAKPTPHYYEEILARIGVESEDAIMIGDDFKNDIVPAQAAGLATWWVTDDPDEAQPIVPSAQGYRIGYPYGKGSLRDLLEKVNAGWLNTIPPHLRTIEQVTPRMLGNLAALDGLAREIDPLSWNVRPIPNEWTPLEILLHLHDSEIHVQRPRLQRILNEDNPFLPPTPEPRRPGEWDTDGKEATQVLADFRAERVQTMALLKNLDQEQWLRPARHSIFGPTTLVEMAHFTARHDRMHINQLCETVGACKE
jgi:HAD superfamily hydrolase (TIGR01549 family)